jgi:hypothetical protein
VLGPFARICVCGVVHFHLCLPDLESCTARAAALCAIKKGVRHAPLKNNNDRSQKMRHVKTQSEIFCEKFWVSQARGTECGFCFFGFSLQFYNGLQKFIGKIRREVITA